MNPPRPWTDRGAALQVSRGARFVVIDGRRVELSPAEAALMTCLLAHGGEPVSRARLLFSMRAGSKGKPLPDRAVDFAIRRLRLKLEPDPSTPRYLFAVRGRGYRFVSPRDADARARVAGIDPNTARSLAVALDRSGGLVQLVGGSAPMRGGMVRAIIDALGGPPGGGVRWISGWFSDPDALTRAVAAACGPDLPVDQTTSQVLQACPSTIVVIDGLTGGNPSFADHLDTWRSVAPQLSWIVTSTTPQHLNADAGVELLPLGDPEELAARIRTCSRDARQALATLLASRGPIDVDLLSDDLDEQTLDALDRTSLVRISGRGVARRASLVTGAEELVAAALSPTDRRHGVTRAHQLVTRLLPEASPSQPWPVLLPERDTQARVMRHHPLFMRVVDGAIRTSQAADLAVAARAFALLCSSFPQERMGTWLQTRGQSLLQASPDLPELQALLHMALAGCAAPLVHPLLIGVPDRTPPKLDDETIATRLTAGDHHLAEALRLAETHQLDIIAAAARTFSARLHTARGALDTARDIAHAARIEHQAWGDSAGMAVAALEMAHIASLQGQPTECTRWLAEAAPRLATSRRPAWAARVHVALGRLKTMEGDDFGARFHLDPALVHGRATNDLPLIAVAARLLAEVEARTGHASEAVLRRRESRRAEQQLADARLLAEGTEKRAIEQTG